MAARSLERVGAIARESAPAHRYVIITDDIVGPLHAAAVVASFGDSHPAAPHPDVLSIPAGETHKTRESWAALTDALLTRGCGRDTTIIALGGGVIGDLAGFVAATFMRGIPVIQVPTTLLAMIDASIGGKTGVDTPAGKNLVGAFHQPAAVVIDPFALLTLPMVHRRAGTAEAIKHGIVADAAYFDQVTSVLPDVLDRPESEAMRSLIDGSIAIKRAVVAADEHERGERAILNFGHTIGHAVERASDYRLLHGESVAIGMVLESRLAVSLGLAVGEVAERIRAAIEAAGLPSALPGGLDPDLLIAAMHLDKKTRAGAVEMSLPREIGRMARVAGRWTVAVEDTAVRAVMGS